MRSILFSLFFFAFISPLLAQTQLSDEAQISVITCGKGNELYSLYGHTALRIKDPVLGLDRVYNYGTFDFRTPNFGLKFVKGDLQYFVSTSSFNDFLFDYDQEKRSVFEQILNFPQDKKQQLYDKLTHTLSSADKYYTYKFIDRNCTTKVVDLVNAALGEKVLQKVGNKDISYRDVIYPEFDGHFYEQWGTSLFFGEKVDRRAEQIFLPIELWQSINTAKYQGKPLLLENKSWLVFEEIPPAKSVWNNVYTYVAILLLLVFINNDELTLIYFVFFGLLGIFFCVSGWYSFHEELKWCYNVLLINPLLLLIAIFYGRKNGKGVYLTSLICVICLALYLGIMFNKIHLLIVSPMIVANAILLLKFALRYRKNRLFRSDKIPS